MTTPQSGAELLARIRPQLRTQSTQLCLRPDLLDAWQEANDELADERAKGVGKRLADKGSTDTPTKRARELAAKVQAIEAEIEATAISFTLRALPKDEWRDLCDQHPPRKDNQVDQFVGYNRDTVNDAAVRACLIDPVFEDCTNKACDHSECGSWQAFVRVCNPSEWGELVEVTTQVNRGVTEAPKSPLASQVLAKRASGSRRRAAGE